MPRSTQAVILSPGADNPGIYRSSGAIGAFQAGFTARSCKDRKAFVGGQGKIEGRTQGSPLTDDSAEGG